jgi:diguanylate cyclase (GGDEF)-like protein
MTNEVVENTINPTMLLEFNRILEMERIHTYYQPIVSLKDGGVLGYEALSRGPENSMLHSPMVLLSIAKLLNKTWELERILRVKALENAWFIKDRLLFLNVDPNVIRDHKFKRGFTKDNLEKMGIDSKSIVLELTERSAIKCYDDFKKILKHYTDQGYQMAIDDAGSGYSGLKTMYEVFPTYLKIDMDFIRDIHKDAFKKAIVKSLVDIAKIVKIKTVAEGIEKEEELRTLVRLGVDYGQGYYIQRPKKSYEPINDFVIQSIHNEHVLLEQIEKYSTAYHYIHHIMIEVPAFSGDTSCKAIYDYIKSHDNTSLCIVDEGVPEGVVTAQDIHRVFAQQFGYAVYSKRDVALIMNKNPMVVDYFDPIHQVAKTALERDDHHLYDDIIVMKGSKYAGIVSVKRILEYSINYEKKYAQELNPLTGLPGNVIINRVLQRVIESKKMTGIMYIDLDNFKGYNDCYGFENGDRVIKETARILEAARDNNGPNMSFIGHIGGDDFVIVSNCSESVLIKLAKEIIESIKGTHSNFYKEEDLKNGFIMSVDRKGNKEKFPLLSVSIAICWGKFIRFDSVEAVSHLLSQLKKEAKKDLINHYAFKNLEI